MSTRSYTLPGAGLKLDSAADIAPYLEDLADNVEAVKFSGHSLGVGACQAIADKLRQSETLRVADFADIFTGRMISEIPTALTAICDALLTAPNLVEVDLSDNAFGGRSVDPMVPFLSAHTGLSVLRLANNGLGPAGGTVIANALLANAQNAHRNGRRSSLCTVICGRNRLEDGSAAAWSTAFAAHTTLIDVRLYQNGIRPDGIRQLAHGLRSCPHLEHLDLQDNTATERGSRAIAAALPHWPRLRVLQLSDCLLRPKGALAIALVLSRGGNRALEQLKLQSDEVDAAAIDVLANAVATEQLPRLASVELNGNRVEGDSDAVESLRSALARQGFADAIDEIDDVEEVGSEDEEDDGDSGDGEGVESDTEAGRDTDVSKEVPGERQTAPATGETPSGAHDRDSKQRTDVDADVDDLAEQLSSATLVK